MYPSGDQAGGRAIVKLHGTCNNACIFCHCSNKRHEYRDIAALEALLDRLPVGIDEIVLSGGEPTIYPDLKGVLGLLRRRDIGIGFVSNGRMFFYPQFCRWAMEAGATYFYLSLHASDPQIHDSITRVAGSWKETVAGIGNLRQISDDVEIVINCVVVRANANALCDLVSLAAGMEADLLKFQVPEIKGLASEKSAEKLLSLHRSAEVIVEALSCADKAGITVAYDGLPACLLPDGLRNRVSNLQTSSISHMAEVSDDCFFRTDLSCRSKWMDCRGCSYNSVCPGFYVGYDLLGDTSVRPI